MGLNGVFPAELISVQHGFSKIDTLHESREKQQKTNCFLSITPKLIFGKRPTKPRTPFNQLFLVERCLYTC